MRLTLSLLGYELDFTFGPRSDDTGTHCSLDGGTTSSYPVGFVRSILPNWDDPGSYHTLDPDDDNED